MKIIWDIRDQKIIPSRRKYLNKYVWDKLWKKQWRKGNMRHYNIYLYLDIYVIQIENFRNLN